MNFREWLQKWYPEAYREWRRALLGSLIGLGSVPLELWVENHRPEVWKIWKEANNG